MKNAPAKVARVKDLITLMRDFAADPVMDKKEKAARIEQCAIAAIRGILANRDHWLIQIDQTDYL